MINIKQPRSTSIHVTARDGVDGLVNHLQFNTFVLVIVVIIALLKLLH